MILGILAALVAAGLVWWLYERSRRSAHPVSGGLHPEITLPHSEPFELHHNALSLCSKKTRLCLAELGVSHASHEVDLIETGSYETISRRFLAVNPAGTVPVLVHEGHPIYESHEQIRYAADHATTDVVLVPEDPALEAEMQVWIDRSSLYGADPIANAHESAGNAVPCLTVPLFAAMMEEIPATRLIEGFLFHPQKLRPLLFLLMKRTGISGLHRSARIGAVVKRGLRFMHEHLDGLEAQLEKTGGPWILGDAFTLADVSWSVIFARLEEGDYGDVFYDTERRPYLVAYVERLHARPSWGEAITAHTHPIAARGLARIRAAKQGDPALRAALEEV